MMNFQKKDERIKPLEVAIIISLLNWEDKLSEGWQYARKIIDKGLFTSQTVNFKKYIQSLLKKSLVEERWNKYSDNRGRLHKKRQYRLKPTLKVYGVLENILILYRRWDYEDVSQSIMKSLEIKGTKIEVTKGLVWKEKIESYLNNEQKKKIPELLDTDFFRLLLKEKKSSVKSYLIKNQKKQLEYLEFEKFCYEAKVKQFQEEIDRISKLVKGGGIKELKENQWYFPKLKSSYDGGDIRLLIR